MAFLIYGIDKYKASHKKYRVSEKSMFILSILGAPIGSLLGMKIFHHKTKKPLFWLVNIISLVIWMILVFKNN